MLKHLAYLDPGTGSMIIQAVVAAIAGVGIFARKTIAAARDKLLALFAKKSKRPETENDQA